MSKRDANARGDVVPAVLREPLPLVPLSEQDVRDLEAAAARWPGLERRFRRALRAAKAAEASRPPPRESE